MSQRLAWPDLIRLPGDKSLSHRLLLMAAMAEGTSVLSGLSEGQDVQATLKALVTLGFEISRRDSVVYVTGSGFKRWNIEGKNIDCENSGTTARHLLGLLSGGIGTGHVTGDLSLTRRPMKRITEPLVLMGSRIKLSEQGSLPATVEGSEHQSLKYALNIPSGQIKSSLMLACANSRVALELSGRLEGRDHTERLIPFFGGYLEQKNQTLHLPVQKAWKAVEYQVPKDPSALANWITMAILNCRACQFEDVLLNPSRLGFIKCLKDMGAKIEFEIMEHFPEPRGRIFVEPSKLVGCELKVPTSSFVDEAPLLALLATQAVGTTVIHDLSELRVKECDRFAVTIEILNRLGARIRAVDDTWIVSGQQVLRSARIDTYHDHRMAMLALVAGTVVELAIDDVDSLKISDPQMWEAVC